MARAIQLSIDGVKSGRGGPFGAVIVKDNAILAEGFNQVTSTNDPTAHAEVVLFATLAENLASSNSRTANFTPRANHVPCALVQSTGPALLEFTLPTPQRTPQKLASMTPLSTAS